MYLSTYVCVYFFIMLATTACSIGTGMIQNALLFSCSPLKNVLEIHYYQMLRDKKG